MKKENMFNTSWNFKIIELVDYITIHKVETSLICTQTSNIKKIKLTVFMWVFLWILLLDSFVKHTTLIN